MKNKVSKLFAISIFVLFIGLIACPIKATNNSIEINRNNDNLFGWLVIIGSIKDYEETESYISFYAINTVVFGWTVRDHFWIDLTFRPGQFNYSKDILNRYGSITDHSVCAMFIFFEAPYDI